MSGFINPPGISNPSNSSAFACLNRRSAANLSPLSAWCIPWIASPAGETMFAVAPAFFQRQFWFFQFDLLKSVGGENRDTFV